ncbi:hypothetical protein QBC38DRAFT_222337 [Podospora fimiseda]|uniref:Mid2 domain-containing protein n=1 Tax=Podospora fimiseda TaxID=252190 RepID=A0AAN7BNG2_9PEZI|nr:hypothetical protein QBC38DRAFT_222337 [Podospora fimiseda]
MRPDFFHQLPPPTVLLLLSSLFDHGDAHFLQHIPRQTEAPQIPTTTIPYHALSVVSFPPLPTPPPPRDLFALRRRQQNTICGYIGGDPALPATCGAGSHCVLDTDSNVVGCCPNGDAVCTAGVFTSCVDENSGSQTEVNPYVFSCGGGQVCFQNTFQGGYSQFGCGTASDIGTVVMLSISGLLNSLTFPTITVSYSVTKTSSSSTTSSTSSSSTQTTTSSETSTSTPATSTPSPTSAPETASDSSNKTGAIVGGTIGGLAVLIALAALIAFLLRRRQKNTRHGPGSIRGRPISPPKPGLSSGFAAISQDSEAYVSPMSHGGPHNPNPVFLQPQQPMRSLSGQLPPISTTTTPMPFRNGEVSPVNDDVSPYAYAGGGMAVSAIASSHTSYPPSEASYNQNNYPPMPTPVAHTPVLHGGGGGGIVDYSESGLESDQVPLTREIDEFSHGFTAALGRIGEEDEEHDLGDGTTGHMVGGGQYGDLNGTNGDGDDIDGHMSSGGASSVYSRGSRPLWQQNRRQSRNLMWM